MKRMDSYANLIMFEFFQYEWKEREDFEALFFRIKKILDDYKWDILNNQPKPELSKFKRLKNP
jgi:hypothetical protein